MKLSESMLSTAKKQVGVPVIREIEVSGQKLRVLLCHKETCIQGNILRWLQLGISAGNDQVVEETVLTFFGSRENVREVPTEMLPTTQEFQRQFIKRVA